MEKQLLNGEIAILEKARGLLAHVAETMKVLSEEDPESSELIDEETRAWFSILHSNMNQFAGNLGNTQVMLGIILRKYE